MTDTPPLAPDWRAYAAEIRQAILARQVEPAASRLTFDDPDCPGKSAITPPSAQPGLTHRQRLLILALAATLGSRQALATHLDGRALIAISDVPLAIMVDLAEMLPAALPEGYLIAQSERAKRAPGAVIVVDPGQHGLSPDSRRDQLEHRLTHALTYPASVILLLPTGIDVSEILGEGQAKILRMRSFDREIVAEMLASTYPDTDAAALRQHLPSDAQLNKTPILWFMLALRCETAEAAAALLSRGGWPQAKDPLDGFREPSPATTRQPDPEGIKLADLAGLGEAKQIALGIAEDLRGWKAGDLQWRDVHRGLLIAGPPGCGKTELARAMAREPGIHLESGSYAQWQGAGHLGHMLKAMRASFRDAADKAPSILFIDEIDAFGSRSGTRTSQNETYEEKVIAGLLELLDGVANREGVVVIGACNFPDRIDPAIRRSGRFDELVQIPRPDAEALATILRQHLGEDLPHTDLDAFGQLALGRSGADCAAAVRNARALARREKRAVTTADLRRTMVPDHLALPQAMRRRAALHEAGHAIVLTALDLAEVKALRLGPNGGETLARWHPTDLTAAVAHRHCTGHLAGRAAELLVLGDASGGAGGDPDSDLGRATQLLLACELSMGLGDQGHLSIAALPEPRLLLDLPPITRARLQSRLNRAVDAAKEILRLHGDLLDRLAGELEASGFIGERELSTRLEGLRRHSVTATSSETPHDPPPTGAESPDDPGPSARTACSSGSPSRCT